MHKHSFNKTDYQYILFLFFLVSCPDGWFHNSGHCLKVLEESVGYSKNFVNTKCEEVGGVVFSPMNEMYTKDAEDLLANTNGLNGTDFWIGNTPPF